MRAKPVVPPAIDDHQPFAVNRRQFLKLMGASLALSGLAGCSFRRPDELIVPYSSQPEPLVPGKPLYFATAVPLGGYGLGLLAETQMGRPIKVEGNPAHPASLGATDAIAQASVLTLWDPDRAGGIITQKQSKTWDDLVAALQQALQGLGAGGAGLRVLSGTVTSPTLVSQMQALLAKYPSARWHQYEPAGLDNSRAGAQIAAGQPVDVQYRFDQATVVLSLDADFLGQGPACVRYGHDLATRRHAWDAQTPMSRLYVVENAPSVTGLYADHRLPLRAGLIESAARAIAGALGVQGGSTGAQIPGVPAGWLEAAAADLQAAPGGSIVIVGESQPPAAHALGHAMNQALGNVGKTVLYTDPVAPLPADQGATLQALVQDMAAGAVQVLIILGGNPVYDAPADLDFAGGLSNVPLSVHLGLYNDETGLASTWHVPEAHYMETWSDVRGFDGTASIVQPLIAPLYDGRSAHELLAALLGQPDLTAYEAVRATWRGQAGGADFQTFWETALRDGIIANTQAPARQVTAAGTGAGQPAPAAEAGQGLEIVFQPDPYLWDGRYANNGWLQELPRPVTKHSWDNVALLSPATADRLGIADHELIELRYEGRTAQGPALILPGHADDSVTVTLGYGRTAGGKVGKGVGWNAYALRTSAAPWFGLGLEVAKAGRRQVIAVTQHEFDQQNRPLAQVATLEEYQEHPEFAGSDETAADPTQSLYPGFKYPGYAWAMAIDLGACTGCQACVVACQAENNIAVVGKEQVRRNRAMHWLRVDAYTIDTGGYVFQPRLCMHCEQAPCEFVCPVHATVHDEDGLNDMVYNRCVGTRYCSNNCPYKVRRFNFLEFSDFKTGALKQRWNPEVTVRSRGVMEKCSYCVQRIRRAEIQARIEGRRVQEGEVMTACQQACPTGAIMFGDLNDASSAVSKLKTLPLDYAMLGELNTRPRTSYLAAVRNPNPAIQRG